MYVDLGEKGRYEVDWRRLEYWFPMKDDHRAFRAPAFLRSCERELGHQRMNDRMRNWMAERGRQMIMEGYNERERERAVDYMRRVGIITSSTSRERVNEFLVGLGIQPYPD